MRRLKIERKYIALRDLAEEPMGNYEGALFQAQI